MLMMIFLVCLVSCAVGFLINEATFNWLYTTNNSMFIVIGVLVLLEACMIKYLEYHKF